MQFGEALFKPHSIQERNKVKRWKERPMTIDWWNGKETKEKILETPKIIWITTSPHQPKQVNKSTIVSELCYIYLRVWH